MASLLACRGCRRGKRASSLPTAPACAARVSREVLDRLLLPWAHRQELLDALDRLPQVLSYNDAFRRNLFLKSERLLAVDWAFLGRGPVGAELAPLVTASVAFLGVARDCWRDLEQTAVEAHLRGLEEAVWRGAPDQPRFGFAASSALRYGPGCVRLVLPALLDETAQTDLGFLILTKAETVGLVLARNAGDGSAQVDLDYVVPRYQGFTLGEFIYRPGGPLAARGYRRVTAPPRMQNAGDYLTDVGFRPEGDAMVRDLA